MNSLLLWSTNAMWSAGEVALVNDDVDTGAKAWHADGISEAVATMAVANFMLFVNAAQFLCANG